MTTALKHRPLPEIPSSQDWHPVGQGEQFGPKKPVAQVSHDAPVKPGGQVHVPAAEHMPAPAHGGEHAADCMSRRAMLFNEEPEGSCNKSAIESQRIKRSVEEGPDATAAQMFCASMTEAAAVLVESREALEVGRALKTAAPE